jgi:hypothetical protein
LNPVFFSGKANVKVPVYRRKQTYKGILGATLGLTSIGKVKVLITLSGRKNNNGKA